MTKSNRIQLPTPWEQRERLQWVRQIGRKTYEIIRTRVIDEVSVLYGHWKIDIQQYDREELINIVRPFVQPWNEKLETGGDPTGVWRRLAAECIAENSMAYEGDKLIRSDYFDLLKREGIDTEDITTYLAEEALGIQERGKETIEIEIIGGKYHRQQAKVVTPSRIYLYLIKKEDDETVSNYKRKVQDAFLSKEEYDGIPIQVAHFSSLSICLNSKEEDKNMNR